jgi:very-short-patch-repair endonuclease
LRNMGWKVIRLWKHEVKKDLDVCLARIIEAVESRDSRR